MRRMQEMNEFYSMGDSGSDVTLVVNTANPAVIALKEASEDQRKVVVQQIYFTAFMSYKPLAPEEFEEFTANTSVLLEKYLQK